MQQSITFNAKMFDYPRIQPGRAPNELRYGIRVHIDNMYDEKETREATTLVYQIISALFPGFQKIDEEKKDLTAHPQWPFSSSRHWDFLFTLQKRK